jgi:hypothetical protein
MLKKLTEIIKLLWRKYRASRVKRIKTKNQKTFLYCECGNEMIGDNDGQKNLSFIRDAYVNERNVVHYKCSKCEAESFFDFDHICPISLPISKDDDIVEQYKLIYK